jgi:hypothetical protein
MVWSYGKIAKPKNAKVNCNIYNGRDKKKRKSTKKIEI